MRNLNITETEKARILFENGNTKKALLKVKNFKIGYSKEEQRILQIAYEAKYSGKELFYKQLGSDLSKVYSNALQIINTRFNLSLKSI